MYMSELEQTIANDPYLSQVLPMPDNFYKKYNIKKPQPIGFKEALNTIQFTNTDAPIYPTGNLDVVKAKVTGSEISGLKF